MSTGKRTDVYYCTWWQTVPLKPMQIEILTPPINKQLELWHHCFFLSTNTVIISSQEKEKEFPVTHHPSLSRHEFLMHVHSTDRWWQHVSLDAIHPGNSWPSWHQCLPVTVTTTSSVLISPARRHWLAFLLAAITCGKWGLWSLASYTLYGCSGRQWGDADPPFPPNLSLNCIFLHPHSFFLTHIHLAESGLLSPSPPPQTQ